MIAIRLAEAAERPTASIIVDIFAERFLIKGRCCRRWSLMSQAAPVL